LASMMMRSSGLTASMSMPPSRPTYGYDVASGFEMVRDCLLHGILGDEVRGGLRPGRGLEP